MTPLKILILAGPNGEGKVLEQLPLEAKSLIEMLPSGDKHFAENLVVGRVAARREIPQEVLKSFAALQRAALRARQTALQTGTPLILVQDGQVVRVAPQELQAGQPAEP